MEVIYIFTGNEQLADYTIVLSMVWIYYLAVYVTDHGKVICTCDKFRLNVKNISIELYPCIDIGLDMNYEIGVKVAI